MKDTLIFDVRNIRDGVFNDHDIEIPTPPLELDLEDMKFIRPVSGTVQLLRHGEDDVYVKAEVFTDIEMQCGRCLEPFATHIAATFELQFTLANNPADIESERTEDGERYYDGETLNISDDTRQAVLIQIPVWPLCSQTCKGLCQGCGVNLNEEHCTCADTDDIESETADINSPFAELPQLLAAGKLKNKPKSRNRKERTSKNGTSKT